MSFPTRPSGADPRDVCMDHLVRNRAALGLDAADLESSRVVGRSRSPLSGATHLYFRQQLGGIEVAHADTGFSVDRDGRILRMDDRFVRGLRRRVNTRRPGITAATAVEYAAAALGLGAAAPRVLRPARGPARETGLDEAGISLDPIPARLVYLPLDDGRAELSWNLVVRTPEHWWDLYVDALDGALLAHFDWTAHGSYRVFPFAQLDPDAGPRTLETDPEDAFASPFGWHDTDGLPGPEVLATGGNNATAYEDVDDDDMGTPVPSPSLVFDFPLDLTDPSTSVDASVANAFYWTNALHDLHYRYGFDEASGNFQSNNYGAGGLGGDAVLVEVQDGGSTNNANFSSPPDGMPGRMQIHPFEVAFAQVNSPPAIAGPKPAAAASFGPLFDSTGVTGNVVQALDPSDGVGPLVTDGCSTLTNPGAIAGNIALIDRGFCPFEDKVSNAEDAGALAVIVVNGGPEPFRMNGLSTTIGIPSLMIGSGDGFAIKQNLAGGVNVTLSGGIRDGSFDGGLLAHEYGHGVSTRLTGGADDSNCLNLLQPSAMGEGWSDWWSLALTAQAGDAGADPRGFASWSLALPTSFGGFRRQPYSIDPAIHGLTYGDLENTVFLHDRGEIWAGVLWEMYWYLVESKGFDPDLFDGTGGNNTALAVVTEGLVLQGCNPTFLDGRDGILLADQTSFGGVHQCRIWGAFAKRGMGDDADDLDNPSLKVPIEGFAVPATCPVCGDVTGDGVADLLDTVSVHRALLALGPGLAVPERCNVSGLTDPNDPDLDGIPNDCDVADGLAIREELAGVFPGIHPLCDETPLP